MPTKTPGRISLYIFIAACFFSCVNSRKEKNTKHYSEEMLRGFEKICEQQKNKDTGFHLADSLYTTFPYISATDKYRYYDFKRSLYETYRSGNRSYDTAITYVDSMIAAIEDKGFQKTMKSEYVRAFNARGEYFSRIGKYSDAIRDINQSKQLNREDNDSCLMGENTKTLASIAIKQSNYSLAANLMKEALQLISRCEKNKDQFVRIQRYLDDLGYIYGNLKDNDSALLYHFAAVNYVNQNKQLMVSDTLFPYEALQNIYGNIGVIYLRKKNYTEAETHLRKSMAIALEVLHDNVSVGQLQYLLGRVYLNTGRISEAEAMANKSFVQINNLQIGFRIDLYSLKADIANAKKQYDKESAYLKQWRLTKDTMYQERIDLLKNNPFAEYEQLDRKYQEDLLKKDNRNQQNKTNAAIIIGILLTLLAIISLFLIRRLRAVMKKRSILYKQLKKTMAEKDIAEKQLREKELLSQEMRLQMEFNDAIIQQRKQISDDMHDELSSSLAALKFYATDIKNNMAGTEAELPLKDITEEIGIVYENARHYMHSLKSNNWETELNLTGFLKEIQQKFSEKGLMNIKLDIDEANLKATLTAHQHDQLYHIIRESIANAIKHSGSTELIIAISFDNEACNFSITDDGKGFNKDDINYGIGIQSMSNRIKELGGELNISSIAAGTTIAGRFPV